MRTSELLRTLMVEQKRTNVPILHRNSNCQNFILFVKNICFSRLDFPCQLVTIITYVLLDVSEGSAELSVPSLSMFSFSE